MPKICDENCPGIICPYDVCPFLYEYTYENELCPGNSGYRYYGDPIKHKKTEWAVEFKKNHSCETCPFVKNEADVGVGIIRDCDAVCKMDIPEILQEMENMSV